MQTYTTDLFVIETDDLNPEIYEPDNAQSIDFYLHYNHKVYDICTFTPEFLKDYFSTDRYPFENSWFWTPNMLFIKEYSIESLTQAIHDIINDNLDSLDDMFPIVDHKYYLS